VTSLDPFLSRPGTRRGFLRSSAVAVGGGSAVLLGACGDEEEESDKSESSPERADAEILNGLIDVENTVIAAYTAGAPLLKGDLVRVGRQILTQEKEHADALSQAVLDLGGRPSKPKADYTGQFPRLREQEQVLRLTDQMENTVIAAYLDALPKLSNGELRAQAASIVTSEAEHLAVLHGAMGRPQAPSAFVAGGR
jgi:rubrerythrin